jgi:hypothetical protein
MKEASINLVTSDIDAKDKVDSAKLSVQVFDPNNKVDQDDGKVEKPEYPTVYFVDGSGQEIHASATDLFHRVGNVIQYEGGKTWKDYLSDSEYVMTGVYNVSGYTIKNSDFDPYGIVMIFEKKTTDTSVSDENTKVPVKVYLVDNNGKKIEATQDTSDFIITKHVENTNNGTVIISDIFEKTAKFLSEHQNDIVANGKPTINGVVVDENYQVDWNNYVTTQGPLQVDIRVDDVFTQDTDKPTQPSQTEGKKISFAELKANQANEVSKDGDISRSFNAFNVETVDSNGVHTLYYSNLPIYNDNLETQLSIDNLGKEGNLLNLIAQAVESGSTAYDVKFNGMDYSTFMGSPTAVSVSDDGLATPQGITVTVYLKK